MIEVDLKSVALKLLTEDLLLIFYFSVLRLFCKVNLKFILSN